MLHAAVSKIPTKYNDFLSKPTTLQKLYNNKYCLDLDIFLTSESVR